MTDIANDSPPARADLFDRLWVRLAFWGCAAIAFLAAAVAVFAAPAAGWHGFLLLAGVTAAGFALLYVLLAGEAAVKGMERGTNAPPPAFAMAAFESARDALVVTDKRGTPVAANPAYIALTGLSTPMARMTAPPGWTGCSAAIRMRHRRCSARLAGLRGP